MNLPPVVSCLICEQGFGTLRKAVNPVERNGVTYDLPMYYYVCCNCGSEFGDRDSLNENAELIRGIL